MYGQFVCTGDFPSHLNLKYIINLRERLIHHFCHQMTKMIKVSDRFCPKLLKTFENSASNSLKTLENSASNSSKTPF